MLAACPAAGKTIMSIYFIEQYIMQNPNARVLVLTHGTTILRTQYTDELKFIKPSFNYYTLRKGTELLTSNASVIIALPQTLNCIHDLPEFDVVIVDEAHQFYFAEMVQTIIKKIKPAFQLLLTGTPSTFIALEYPIISVSVDRLMDYGMIDDLYVEVCESAYDFGYNDFNNSNDLKSETKIKVSQTNETLTGLLDKLKNRIVGKTMIACQNIVQAKQVFKFLSTNKIKTVISTCENDIDSAKIAEFKKTKSCKVLVVVYRGILGFNLPELEMVIDMTISQNINRIFQLLARVLRKHPANKEKKFIKISPYNLLNYNQYVMTAVLCLTNEKYYNTFNGRNFIDMKIPVECEPADKFKSNSRNRRNIKSFKCINYEGMPAVQLFKTVFRNKNQIYTKLSNLKSQLSSDGSNVGRNYWTKELCGAEAIKYNRKTDWLKDNSASYHAAHEHGWIEYCCQHMSNGRVPNRYWTKKLCKNEANKYKSKTEWLKGNCSSYDAAVRNGWVDICSKHMIPKTKPKGFWTKSRCKKEALKYNTIKEWSNCNSTSYSVARLRNWLEYCTSHMVRKSMPRGYWTKKNCSSVALNYNTMNDWIKSHRASYTAAYRYGWIGYCSKHMQQKSKPKNFWTKERCEKMALKFRRRVDWQKGHSTSYQIAYKNRWIEDCAKHMNNSKII